MLVCEIMPSLILQDYVNWNLTILCATPVLLICCLLLSFTHSMPILLFPFQRQIIKIIKKDLLKICGLPLQVMLLTENIQLILDAVRTSNVLEIQVCFYNICNCPMLQKFIGFEIEDILLALKSMFLVLHQILI